MLGLTVTHDILLWKHNPVPRYSFTFVAAGHKGSSMGMRTKQWALELCAYAIIPSKMTALFHDIKQNQWH